jgi:hypothetical protein
MVVDGLRSDVLSVGELGDDTVAEVAERIADLLGRSLPGRVLELLSDVAAELSAELPEGRVEIRVVGDEVELAYVGDQHAAADRGVEAGDGGQGTAEGGDVSARISLRLSEGLKSRVEESAARQGLSVNAYIVRTLERGSFGERGRGPAGVGNRLRGYGST